MFVCSIVGIAGCLPNGICQLAVYLQLVTSSIIGPKNEASESGLLRATLPTEVVTVSMYVMPVASSLTMQLMLTVDILGATTTPKGMVPRGSSRATSTSSGVLQVGCHSCKATCDRVGGHTSANACTDKEGLGGVEAFSAERLEALLVRSRGAELVPPLASRPWMVGGSPQWPSLVGMGVGLFPIPENFRPLLPLVGSGMLHVLVERVFGF